VTMAKAASLLRMPPDALTPSLVPTVSAINRTAGSLAPPAG